MKIWAKVNGLQFRAIHYYPEADKINNENSKTLKFPHSHRFVVNVKISQEHNNRDVELILLEDNIGYYIQELQQRVGGLTPSNMSVEDMCNFIYLKLKAIYPTREISVEILEDGINGAEISD